MRQRRLKKLNKVLTNGCFDILHLGHIKYLKKARNLGDSLCVAVNNDKSVRRLKGKGRPIQNEKTRLEIIKSLKFVDEVFLFEDMMKILKKYKPMIYVKGGDYTIDTINQEERCFIESYGGKIYIIKTGVKDSTTKVYERFINNFNR